MQSSLSDSKKLAEVNRTIRPYVELRDISYYALKQAEKEEYGSFHNCLISMAFCAFSIEAFLNDLGGNLITDWHSFERGIDYKEKLRKIFNTLGQEYNNKQEPFCYLNDIFDYRKEIVHASTRKIVKKTTIKQNGVPDMPLAQWEKMTNLARAKSFFKHTEEIINKLYSLAGYLDNPLDSPSDAFWISK